MSSLRHEISSRPFFKTLYEKFHGKGITCAHCNAKFPTHVKLKEHILVSHPNEMFPCGVCSSSFNSAQKQEFHLKTNHPKAEPMNICEHCQKSFLVERLLSYPIDEFHKNESKYFDKPFACPADLCEKRFRLQSSFIQHARLHVPHTRNYAKKRKKKAN